MLLAIRKDLGHQNNKLDDKTILGVFLNDVEIISIESNQKSLKAS